MIDLATLKTELSTDPLSLGYAAHIAAGDHVAVAALLNASTGPGAATINLPSISKGAALRGVIPALDQLATGVILSGTAISAKTKAKWDNRFAAMRSGDDTLVLDALFVGLLSQLVSDGLMPQPYIDDMTKRVGSRAEKLFGAGTVIQHGDVSISLRAE